MMSVEMARTAQQWDGQRSSVACARVQLDVLAQILAEMTSAES